MRTVAENIHSLEDWFNKPLKGNQFEMFARRVNFIPPRAMTVIVDRIIDESPPTPGRFPTVQKIFAGWQVWKKENPHLIARQDRTGCPDCFGTGFLWFEKYDPETRGFYEVVARCGACENWRIDVDHTSPIPIKTRADLESNGVKVMDFQPAPIPRKNLSSIANELFEPI